MGIEQSGGTSDTAQSGIRTAPSPSHTQSAGGFATDFLSMSSNLGINRIDATIEPYLNKLVENIKKKFNNAVLKSLTQNSNAYYIEHRLPDGKAVVFGLLFIQSSDPVNQDLVPASQRLNYMAQELQAVYAANKTPYELLDARVILSGYQPEMDRVEQMADEIVRTIEISTTPTYRDATIAFLNGTEFVASWNVGEARRLEDQYSPHGVRPRMDIGLVIKAKVRNQFAGREMRGLENEYRFVGVVGGYVEVFEKQDVPGPNGQIEKRYQPTFNITVMRSIIPLEGMAQIMMAALAGKIVNNPSFWANQWTEFGEGKNNPGTLEENPQSRGKPVAITNREELYSFIQARMTAPHIVLQQQTGRDTIPGMWRLAEKDATFAERVARFFGVPEGSIPIQQIAAPLEKRFDGIFGDQLGSFKDSREVDYFWYAANSGFGAITREIRNTFLSVSQDPRDRARLVQACTNTFVPIWLTDVIFLNPDYLKWLIERTRQAGIVITDPDARDEGRPLSSLLTGFGSTSGMGTLISPTIGSGPSLNLGGMYRF